MSVFKQAHRRSTTYLTTALLVTVIIAHISYGGAQTRNVVFELSENISSRQVVTVNLGDTLVLNCSITLYAEIVKQTLAQMDACDSSVGNPNGETPVRLSSCLGGVRTHLIPIEASSEMLDSSQSYDAGNSYYFTSYTPVGVTGIVAELYDGVADGLCSAGFQLVLEVLEGPTTSATTVVDTVSTTKSNNVSSTVTTANVDSGDNSTTIGGGPGDNETINPSVNVGGLNGAGRTGSSSLSLIITSASVLLCVLLSKFLY